MWTQILSIKTGEKGLFLKPYKFHYFFIVDLPEWIPLPAVVWRHTRYTRYAGSRLRSKKNNFIIEVKNKTADRISTCYYRHRLLYEPLLNRCYLFQLSEAKIFFKNYLTSEVIKVKKWGCLVTCEQGGWSAASSRPPRSHSQSRQCYPLIGLIGFIVLIYENSKLYGGVQYEYHW